MAMPSSSAAEKNTLAMESESKIATTCHQCRQKTTNFSASCTKVKKNRCCPIKICYKCLSKIYHEVAEEIEARGDWICPRCRDECKCSICMKKKGLKPIGRVSSKVKAEGFQSVSESMDASDEEPVYVGSPRSEGKEEASQSEDDVDLPLPQGVPLKTVAGIVLAPADVGNVLQFLKFFETFGEVLDFSKSNAETLLREASCPPQNFIAFQFYANFLSFIEADMEEEWPSTSNNNSWFQVMGDCISKSRVSEHVLKELPPDCFSRGDDGYDALNFSQKLRLLNFICDEMLQTNTLRSWITRQHEVFAERKTEAKRKIAPAKNKANLLKKKLHDEKEKLKNADNPVSLSELEAIVLQIESDAAQAEMEVAEATVVVSKRYPKVVRAEPHTSDARRGRIFWKLEGYNNEDDVLRQDLGTWDAAPTEEKWFFYGEEMKEPIEQYLSSLTLREKKGRKMRKRRSEIPPESSEEDTEQSSMVN